MAERRGRLCPRPRQQTRGGAESTHRAPCFETGAARGGFAQLVVDRGGLQCGASERWGVSVQIPLTYAISPGFSDYDQNLELSSKERHDSVYNCILSVATRTFLVPFLNFLNFLAPHPTRPTKPLSGALGGFSD